MVGTAYGSSLYHVKPDSLTGGATRMTEAGAATSSVRSLGNGEIASEWGIRVMRTKIFKKPGFGMFSKTRMVLLRWVLVMDGERMSSL